MDKVQTKFYSENDIMSDVDLKAVDIELGVVQSGAEEEHSDDSPKLAAVGSSKQAFSRSWSSLKDEDKGRRSLDGGSLPLIKEGISRRRRRKAKKSLPQSPHMAVGSTWHKTSSATAQSWLDPMETKIDAAHYSRDLDTLHLQFAKKSRRANMAEITSLFEEQKSVDMTEGSSEEESEADNDDSDLELETGTVTANGSDKQKTLTWFDGVLGRCLLNILGIILFVRVGWVVGQAGVPLTILTMLISACITFLTILSMCALSTNGEVRGGGAYYLMSRSLGPAAGGAVGILFSFGNMVAVSMYFVGFAETLVSSVTGSNEKGILFNDPTNDIRLWANLLLVAEFLVLLVGLKYVAKLQMALLLVLLIIIATFFVGSLYKTDSVPHSTYKDWVPEPRCSVLNDELSREKVLFAANGWLSNLRSNMKPRYVSFNGVSYNFFRVLGVVFPAFTGIMAGANVSGDLQNPGADIPKGTLIAWAVSTTLYVTLAVFMGAIASNCYLLNEYMIMAVASMQPWLLRVGIFLSTAMAGLTSMSSAPRLLQAVARDHLVPVLNPFEKVTANGDPINGYYLCVVVVFALNCIGDLNVIAPLITEFFIMTYGMVNAACYGLSVAKTPGWRPAFKYYNKYTALCGALLCFVVMFLIDWMFALATLALGIGIFQYISFRDPNVNWGSIADSRAYFDVYNALLRLRRTREHIKNWRPSFLVLVRDPMKTPHSVLFTQTLTKAYAPIFYGTIRTGDCVTDMRKFRAVYNGGYVPQHSIPRKSQIEGFYECVIAKSLRSGAHMLMQLSGTGRLRPNTLVLGFKHNWLKLRGTEKGKAVVSEYVSILRDSVKMGYGVMLIAQMRHVNFLQPHFIPPTSTLVFDDDSDEDAEDADDLKHRSSGKRKDRQMSPVSECESLCTEVTESALSEMAAEQNIWASEQRLWAEGQGIRPIVDVWWLVDDGGLLILLPHLMKQHRFWRSVRLRANVIGDESTMATEIVAVRKLITDFRLQFEEPRHVALESPRPSARTVRRFEQMAQCKLDAIKRKDVVSRWLRVSELIYKHSRYSGLVVVTLPQPRHMRSQVYMALLHMICRPNKMPPFILMRGNGESALTFYLQ